jgi:hypothetical protein
MFRYLTTSKPFILIVLDNDILVNWLDVDSVKGTSSRGLRAKVFKRLPVISL